MRVLNVLSDKQPAGGAVDQRSVKIAARPTGFVAAAVLVLGLLLAFASPAWAAEFIVTQSDDPAPDGCQQADQGGCSLREAVIAANTNGQADTILLPPAANVDPAGSSYSLTQVRSNGNGRNEDQARLGDLDVLNDVQGEDLIIDGTDPDSPTVNVRSAGIDRAFDIQNNATVTLQDLQISGGDSRQVGGGLRNAGNTDGREQHYQ